MILQLLQSKCIPVLIYSLEVFALGSSDLMFKTSNIAVITECHLLFNFVLPNVQIASRTQKTCSQFWQSFVNSIVSHLSNYSFLLVYCVLLCYHVWWIKLFVHSALAAATGLTPHNMSGRVSFDVLFCDHAAITCFKTILSFTMCVLSLKFK